MATHHREIIAHRGYSAVAPENTCVAFQKALEAGADSVELDVRLSENGFPVVIHDETLDRTTPSSGLVCDTLWDEMKTLDAGRWFDEGFAGETIPSLLEALEVVRQFPQSIYLDIKAHPTWTRDRIRQVAQLIESRIEGDRCYVCSFDAALLASFAEVSSQLHLGYHAINSTEFRDRIEYAAERQGILVSLYRPLLETPELVELARSQGVDVVAWTVDDPKVWQQLQAIGIRRVMVLRQLR